MRENSGKINSENKAYFEIFNSLLHPVLVFDFGLKFFEANATAIEYFGSKREEIIGVSIKEFVAEQKYELFELISDSVAKHGSFYTQFFEKSKSGAEVLWEITGSSICVEGKDYIFCMLRDITNQNNVESEIRSTMEMYRRIFEMSPEAIVLTDNRGVIQKINNRIYDWLGYNNDEVVGEQILNLDFIKESEKRKLKRLFLERRREEIVHNYEIEFISKSGDTFTGEFYSTPLKDDKGNITHDLSLISNITEKKSSEKKLLESEQKHRSIFEYANTAIVMFGDDSVITICNSKFAEMSKLTKEEIEGKVIWRRFVHKDDLLTMANYHERRSSGKMAASDYEFRFVDAEGSVRHIEIRVSIIPGTKTRVASLLDITQKRSAEMLAQALYKISRAVHTTENLNELFRTIHKSLSGIIDTTNFYIALLDRKKEMISFPYFTDEIDDNFPDIPLSDEKSLTAIVISGEKTLFLKEGQLREMFPGEYKSDVYGTVPKVWLGAPMLIHGEVFGAICLQSYSNENIYSEKELELLESISEQIATAIERKMAVEETTRLNVELEQRVKERTFELTGALRKLEDEIITRKKTEHELREAQIQLSTSLESERELGEIKSRFISMISHEYRTPLTVILSATYIIEEAIRRGDETLGGEHLSKIRLSVDALTKLLENVLTFGKSQDGALDFNPTKFNLIKLTREILEHVKIIDKNRHIFLFSHHADNPILETDAGLFRQIMLNLLMNAIKFSKKGTTVKIDIIEEQVRFAISVIDNGEGIAKEEIDKIFDPFFKSEKEIGIVSGAGLGLSIVKKCVEQMNAEIDVKSEPGQGSTFTIFLPK